MPKLRSATTTHGRNMAGARALWRATGMTDQDFGKPIIAVVNSFTQFVPGHVHLKDLGQLVAREIEAAGGVAKEFNTIAVDDGIAMGHGGMLYSLPSRELIADSVEYMVSAHCADAMVCISNCDKITPGMLMAALRINIPVIFVSGGPMEAGKTKLSDQIIKLDLVDAMIQGADPKVSDAQSEQVERSACPTCGSCSGMFTANSMNCLTEALGLSQPGNGSLLATHSDREQLFKLAGQRIVTLAKRWYEQDDASALPRNIATKAAFENAMALDIAMGGSTNTVLHLLAAAQEAGVDFTMADIDRMSRKVPQLLQGGALHPEVPYGRCAPRWWRGGDSGPAGKSGSWCTGIPATCWAPRWWSCWPNMTSAASRVRRWWTLSRRPGRNPAPPRPSARDCRWPGAGSGPRRGLHPLAGQRLQPGRGLAVLAGNLALNGAIVKTAGVDEENLTFRGPAWVFESQDTAVAGILDGTVEGR